MPLEKAIKSAIEYERKMKDLYLDAMKQTDTIQARRFFQIMAKDEEKHEQYLHARLKEWTQTGKIHLSDLVSAIPSHETIQKSLNQCKTMIAKDKQVVVESDLEILKKIRKLEAESSNFYATIIQQLKEKEQSLFTHFLRIEVGHEQYIEAQIASLLENGVWLLPTEE